MWPDISGCSAASAFFVLGTAGRSQHSGMNRCQLARRLIMFTSFVNTFSPIFGDYVYIGGGLLTLIVVILLVLFLARRV
jgi:hypothetical protein